MVMNTMQNIVKSLAVTGRRMFMPAISTMQVTLNARRFGGRGNQEPNQHEL